MAGIRVNSGVIRIDVNDNGDVIILRKDLGFVNNVKAFIEGLNSLQNEYDSQVAKINPDDTDAKLDLVYNLHKELHDGLDLLFGKDTCKKVFGDGVVDVIPTMDAVIDFVKQITPFVKQLTNSLIEENKANEVVVTPVKTVGYMGGVAEATNVTSFSDKANRFTALRQQLGVETDND